MIMVKAGSAVDDMINTLIPHLEKGDIIIDGGILISRHNRRTAMVESKGLLYIGTGVSGGEEGALLGPSIMPGGSKEAWPFVKPYSRQLQPRLMMVLHAATGWRERGRTFC